MKIKHLETLTESAYFHGGALPCVVRVMKAAPSNMTIAMHGHEFSELVLVASGTIKHLRRKRTDILQAGDFLVVHPGTRHGFAEPSADTIVYNLIYVDTLREYAHLLSANPLVRRIFPSDDKDRQEDILGSLDARTLKRAIRLMDEIRYEEKSPARFSGVTCGALFSATLALLTRGVQETNAPENIRSLLKAEIGYINEHLDEKITLKTLRGVSGQSPSSLNRRFLAAFGKSPIDYLIERRLDKAELLRATTDSSLATIALQCGFADASHLLRTRRNHGRRQVPIPSMKMF